MGPAGVSAMPSPMAPTRAIASCSLMARADEELAVAVAAGNRRGNDAGHLPAERVDARRDVVAHRPMNIRIARDAFFQLAASGLELRLDQGQQASWKLRKRNGRRQDELERDEAHGDADELGPVGER